MTDKTADTGKPASRQPLSVALAALLASPALVRAILYVAVIVGSVAVFTASIGVVGTSLRDAVISSVGNQPKVQAPRADVPLPQVITPTAPSAAAPQPTALAEPAVPESSVVTLTSLSPEDSSAFSTVPPAGAQTMRVVSDVTIRTAPDRSGVALGAIGSGEIVTAMAVENGWVQIAQNGSVLGWVYGSYLAPDEDPQR
jgi:hypothetical protein